MVSYELKVLVEDEIEEIKKGNNSTFTAYHRSIPPFFDKIISHLE
jgi:hypothetical protein